MREVNKHIVSGYFKEMKITLHDGATNFFESYFDRQLAPSDESKAKLGQIMPILNSL
jgi:hypothetical protein